VAIARTGEALARQGENMRIDRTIAVAAVVGAMAVGFAGPAWADVLNNGKYNVDKTGVYAPGNTAAMWTVHLCGSGCAQIVGENGATYEAHLADGRWTATLHKADAIDCRNGTSAPGTSVLSLDAATLRGTIVGTSDGPACGSPAPITGGALYFAMDQA
jgi:hypothetical protein